MRAKSATCSWLSSCISQKAGAVSSRVRDAATTYEPTNTTMTGSSQLLVACSTTYQPRQQVYVQAYSSRELQMQRVRTNHATAGRDQIKKADRINAF